MLPPAHIAYTWLAFDLAQEYLDVTEDVDYRLIALAAIGPDLIDKPLGHTSTNDIRRPSSSLIR